MLEMFATIDCECGFLTIYNRQNEESVFETAFDSSKLLTNVWSLLDDYRGKLRTIYVKQFGDDGKIENLLSFVDESFKNRIVFIQNKNDLIKPPVPLKAGDKIVRFSMTHPATIFTFSKMTDTKNCEEISRFVVRLWKHNIEFADMNVIFSVFGIVEGEAYLLLESKFKIPQVLYENATQKIQHKFKSIFHVQNYNFHEFVKIWECNRGTIWYHYTVKNDYDPNGRIYYGNLNDERTDIKVNDVPMKYPQPIQNYESKTNLMGIDFGTTHCCLAVSRNKTINVIPIDKSADLWIRSAISFYEQEPLIGKVAFNQLRDKPYSVVYGPKAQPLQTEYAFVLGSQIQYEGEAHFFVRTENEIKKVSLTDVVSVFLKNMKKSATRFQSDLNYGDEIMKAVVTIPILSNDFESKSQRIWLEALIKGIKQCKIELLDVIPELYANLLYYLSKSDVRDGQTVLVIDSGGGFTGIQGYRIENKKIVMLKLKNQTSSRFIAAYAGCSFTDDLSHFIIKRFMKTYGINILENSKTRFKFYEIVENIKLTLALEKKATISLSEFGAQFDGTYTITFGMMMSIFSERIKKCRKYLIEWKKMYKQFDFVFMAGGSCRIPSLQKCIKGQFSKAKIIMDGEVEIVTAMGASIHGLQILNGESKSFLNLEKFKTETKTEENMTQIKQKQASKSCELPENLNFNEPEKKRNEKLMHQFLPEKINQ